MALMTVKRLPAIAGVMIVEASVSSPQELIHSRTCGEAGKVGFFPEAMATSSCVTDELSPFRLDQRRHQSVSVESMRGNPTRASNGLRGTCPKRAAACWGGRT